MNSQDRIVVFTCNWDAYSAMEQAGRQGLSYPAAVAPVRVPCLGRLHPGLILRAFEQGAMGALLLGCELDHCHHQFGRTEAEGLVAVSRQLLQLLGYDEAVLGIASIRPKDGRQWVKTVEGFTQRLMTQA